MPLLKPTRTGVSVTVRVTPRASKSAIAGVREDTMLVRLAAAPVDGRPTTRSWFCSPACSDIPKQDIEIVSGERSRTKRLHLAGASVSAMDERLAALLGK